MIDALALERLAHEQGLDGRQNVCSVQARECDETALHVACTRLIFRWEASFHELERIAAFKEDITRDWTLTEHFSMTFADFRPSLQDERR